MNVIGRKHIFLAFSGVLVIASFVALATWGLKLGIDFTGGSMLEVSFPDGRPGADLVAKKLDGVGLGDAVVQFAGEKEVMMRFRDIDEPTHQNILHELGTLGRVSEQRFDTIGPTIGAELKRRAIIALVLALAVIILYISWAFRQVSKPLSSWKYGTVAVIVALFHDVIIPVGAFSFLGHFKGAEADTLFITALLTILGFSVHDTIVVFDRTREHLRTLKKPELFDETVNQSVNETFVRSLFTSLTVLLVLAVIFLIGGASTHYFAFTLIVGVLFGTYSSIFIASPLLVIWNDFTRKRL